MKLLFSFWILSSVCIVNAFSCDKTVSAFTPCHSFVNGSEPTPGTQCCSCIKQLNQMTQKKDSRYTACLCFREIAKSVPVNLEKAEILPSLCNIRLNIPFDRNWDCQKFKHPPGNRWGFKKSIIFWMIAIMVVIPVFAFLAVCITLWNHHRRNRNRPLNTEIRNSLENITFVSAEETPVSSACTICQLEFHSDQRLTILPSCMHAYHAACIDGWLDVASTCPNCRLPIGLERLPIEEDV